jgi:recombination protein RecR
MKAYPPVVLDVIDRIKRLPGFGEKSAARLTLYLINAPDREAESLAEAILRMKRDLTFCKKCFHLAEGDLCTICSDPSRNKEEICVVETISDLIAIEQAGVFKGLYHVLHGVLNPLENIGPDEIRIKELVDRIQTEPIKEVIIATNPSAQGEATAHYILGLIQKEGLKVTRIGLGIPMGGDIKYTDKMTITQAMLGRRPFDREETKR